MFALEIKPETPVMIVPVGVAVGVGVGVATAMGSGELEQTHESFTRLDRAGFSDLRTQNGLSALHFDISGQNFKPFCFINAHVGSLV